MKRRNFLLSIGAIFGLATGAVAAKAAPVSGRSFDYPFTGPVPPYVERGGFYVEWEEHRGPIFAVNHHPFVADCGVYYDNGCALIPVAPPTDPEEWKNGPPHGCYRENYGHYFLSDKDAGVKVFVAYTVGGRFTGEPSFSFREGEYYSNGDGSILVDLPCLVMPGDCVTVNEALYRVVSVSTASLSRSIARAKPGGWAVLKLVGA